LLLSYYYFGEKISFELALALEICQVILLPSLSIVGLAFWGLVIYDKWLIMPRSEFPKD